MGILNGPAAGDLEFVGTIQKYADTPTDDGDVTRGPAAIATGVRIGIRFLSGRALIEAQQVHADAQYKLVFRWQSAFDGVLNDNCRAVVSGRTFEFVAPPNNVGLRDRYVEVLARETA